MCHTVPFRSLSGSDHTVRYTPNRGYAGHMTQQSRGREGEINSGADTPIAFGAASGSEATLGQPIIRTKTIPWAQVGSAVRNPDRSRGRHLFRIPDGQEVIQFRPFKRFLSN